MGHPMEDFWDRAREASGRTSARYEHVLAALRDVPLSEFTVGQLWDIHRLVAREWGEPSLIERLERLVDDRSRQLKHGMFVRYKNPKKGQRGKGIITSYPRRGTTLVRVRGPRGWDGWCRIDELEIVSP